MLVIGQEIFKQRKMIRRRDCGNGKKFALICGFGISGKIAEQFASQHFNGKVDVFLRDSDRELIALEGLVLPRCQNPKQLKPQQVWTLPLTLARDYEYINSISLFPDVRLRQRTTAKETVIVFHGFAPSDYEKLAIYGLQGFRI